MALLIFEAYFNPFRVLANIRVDPGKIIISGTRIKMGSPRYAGYTSDNRPYEVTAQAASQDITKPDLIDLRGNPGQNGNAGQVDHDHDGPDRSL